MTKEGDNWNSGDPYEYFMGRWSQQMAPEFLNWLNPSYNLNWLDIGCGTGALSMVIHNKYKPATLSLIDPSAGFIAKAKQRLNGYAEYQVGNVSDIPRVNDSVDIVVSGLALNFFPDIAIAFHEMKRVVKPGGLIAAYVWDYAGKMELLRIFWDTASEIDPEAKRLDEAVRFPVCNPEKLQTLFDGAGLNNLETSWLEIDTVFKNFDDYWNPFLGGQGPAPSYLASLNDELKNKFKTRLIEKMNINKDGSIRLLARAIAIRGYYNP